MKNKIQLLINVCSDCKVDDLEYETTIISFFGSLQIDIAGGADDIYLINDCIQNNTDQIELARKENEDCCIEVVLNESGEWEDVFWNKFYEIESVKLVDDG